MGRTTAFIEPQLPRNKSKRLNHIVRWLQKKTQPTWNQWKSCHWFKWKQDVLNVHFIKWTFCGSPASRCELDLEHMDRADLIPMKNKSMHTICKLKRNKQLPENCVKRRVGVWLQGICRSHVRWDVHPSHFVPKHMASAQILLWESDAFWFLRLLSPHRSTKGHSVPHDHGLPQVPYSAFMDIALPSSSRHYTVSKLLAHCYKKEGERIYVTASLIQRCLFLSRALFYPHKGCFAYQVYQKAAQGSFISCHLGWWCQATLSDPESKYPKKLFREGKGDLEHRHRYLISCVVILPSSPP